MDPPSYPYWIPGQARFFTVGVTHTYLIPLFIDTLFCTQVFVICHIANLYMMQLYLTYFSNYIFTLSKPLLTTLSIPWSAVLQLAERSSLSSTTKLPSTVDLQSAHSQDFVMLKFQLKSHCVFWFTSAGSAKRYLLSKDGANICEVLEFSDEPRSWFIGNSVQRGTCIVPYNIGGL